ncbi:DUF1345 domain-containing protein [Brachybacterium sp. EF45031]|uniref:DUF1345 domain-containing protein n=1 Tax=Brachybacterium sillae TaxID=2810536 RepID=UPI00217DEEBB|nr:DUF1345 domain-containing protein [Brachybacterium sillae]MCS6712190.1 DUF1345 domain-containing protein [Brachybacterium sillae]
MSIGIAVAVVLSVIVAESVPEFRSALWEARVSAALALSALIVTLYGFIEATLMIAVYRRLSRRELIILARRRRARRAIPLYRWTDTGSPQSEAAQLAGVAAIGIGLLLTRPDGLPTGLLMAIAIGSVIMAWISCASAYAIEYAALDAHGDALEVPGAAPPDRAFEEYLHLAIIVQTTNGPADVLPRTRAARHAVRTQSILAYITTTVLIAMGASVLLTAL